jgi:hypothetical protein
MISSYKVLGQVKPSATTDTTLYTVPAATQTVSSTLSICNQSATSATFRVRIKVNGAADDGKQYLVYDAPIDGNDTLLLTFGASLAVADVVRVYASSADLSFQLFGTELA